MRLWDLWLLNQLRSLNDNVWIVPRDFVKFETTNVLTSQPPTLPKNSNNNKIKDCPNLTKKKGPLLQDYDEEKLRASGWEDGSNSTVLYYTFYYNKNEILTRVFSPSYWPKQKSSRTLVTVSLLFSYLTSLNSVDREVVPWTFYGFTCIKCEVLKSRTKLKNTRFTVRITLYNLY